MRPAFFHCTWCSAPRGAGASREKHAVIESIAKVVRRSSCHCGGRRKEARTARPSPACAASRTSAAARCPSLCIAGQCSVPATKASSECGGSIPGNRAGGAAGRSGPDSLPAGALLRRAAGITCGKWTEAPAVPIRPALVAIAKHTFNYEPLNECGGDRRGAPDGGRSPLFNPKARCRTARLPPLAAAGAKKSPRKPKPCLPRKRPSCDWCTPPSRRRRRRSVRKTAGRC
jgi:hypothetical protein